MTENEKERLDYEKYRTNFEFFIELIINFIIEKLKEKKYEQILELTRAFLISNIDKLLEKSKIPKNLFMMEFKLDKDKFVKFIINLISPNFKFIMKLYNKDIFNKLENILIECFNQFK